jgi:hypothetical protein
MSGEQHMRCHILADFSSWSNEQPCLVYQLLDCLRARPPSDAPNQPVPAPDNTSVTHAPQTRGKSSHLNEACVVRSRYLYGVVPDFASLHFLCVSTVCDFENAWSALISIGNDLCGISGFFLAVSMRNGAGFFWVHRGVQ